MEKKKKRLFPPSFSSFPLPSPLLLPGERGEGGGEERNFRPTISQVGGGEKKGFLSLYPRWLSGGGRLPHCDDDKRKKRACGSFHSCVWGKGLSQGCFSKGFPLLLPLHPPLLLYRSRARKAGRVRNEWMGREVGARKFFWSNR